MNVAIVGCGYVGIELGTRLRDRGHDVVGVRRSDEGLDAVEAAGLRPIRADATDADSLADVPDVDWLVYAASAGRDGDPRKTYVEGLETTVEAFANRESPPDRLVYTSSTGVYGDHGGDQVDEATPLSPASDRQQVLADAETIALDAPIDGTVVRLGGIYGPGRYRVERYLERPVPEGHLNLVHRDDAAGIVAFLLDEDLARGEVVLGVDDEPVYKPDLAAWLAGEAGTEPPPTRSLADVREDPSLSASRRRRLLADKRCSNEKLRGLGYEFDYPTFRAGYAEAVEAYLAEQSGDG